MPKCQTSSCKSNATEFCQYCRHLKCVDHRITCPTCQFTHCDNPVCSATKSQCRSAKLPTPRASSASPSRSIPCPKCGKKFKKLPHGICKDCRTRPSTPPASAKTFLPMQQTVTVAAAASCSKPDCNLPVHEEELCFIHLQSEKIDAITKDMAAADFMKPPAVVKKSACRNCDQIAAFFPQRFCASCETFLKRKKTTDITRAFIDLKVALNENVLGNEPIVCQLDDLIKIPKKSIDEMQFCFPLLLTLEIFLYRYQDLLLLQDYAAQFEILLTHFQTHYSATELAIKTVPEFIGLQTKLLQEIRLYQANIYTSKDKISESMVGHVQGLVKTLTQPCAAIQDPHFTQNHMHIVACTLMLYLADDPQLTPGMQQLRKELNNYVQLSYHLKLYELPEIASANLSQLFAMIQK